MIKVQNIYNLNDVVFRAKKILETVKLIHDRSNYVSEVDIENLQKRLEEEIYTNTSDGEFRLLVKILNTLAECYNIEKYYIYLPNANIRFSENSVRAIDKILRGVNIQETEAKNFKSDVGKIAEDFHEKGNKSFSQNSSCSYGGIIILLDDNLKIYALRRKIDGEKFKLVQSNEYVLHKYIYNTDSIGRIKSVHGQLQIPAQTTKRPTLPDVADRLKSDDRGHLIAREFLGVDTVGNLVPMNWEVNQDVNKEGGYRKLEKDLKEAAEKTGNKVELRVEPIYTDDSRRPSRFYYIYEVTGNENYSKRGYIKNTPTPRKRSNKNGK